MVRIFKIVLISSLFAVLSANGQDTRPAHEIYAMMIFNFIKYVQWPADNSSSEFLIGVIGNNEIYNTLTEWYAGKKTGDKIFVIKKFNDVSEITTSQLVFIDRSKSNEFDDIIKKVRGKPILIITDRNGLGAKGSCINFRKVDEKLRFELNLKAIEASNLKVSKALSSLAILI